MYKRNRRPEFPFMTHKVKIFRVKIFLMREVSDRWISTDRHIAQFLSGRGAF